VNAHTGRRSRVASPATDRGPETADATPSVVVSRATFTADEVAALLGVDRKTVYQAAEQGQIPGTLRIGRCVRFARATVLAWLGQGASSEGNTP